MKSTVIPFSAKCNRWTKCVMFAQSRQIDVIIYMYDILANKDIVTFQNRLVYSYLMDVLPELLQPISHVH